MEQYYKTMTEKLVFYICRYHQHEGIELIKLTYGVEVLLRQFLKIVIVFVVAVITGTVIETTIVIIAFNFLRNQACGLHARTSGQCLFFSLVLFDLGTWCIQGLYVSTALNIVIYGVLTLCVAKYAPSGTKKVPIKNEVLKNRLRMRSIIVTILLGILTIIIPNQSFRVLTTYGLCIEVITILPITYKLLKMEDER